MNVPSEKQAPLSRATVQSKASILHWNDFERLRNADKLLVIYGAGANGRKFLNINRVVPHYFCDMNADNIGQVTSDDGKHVIDCIKLHRLCEILRGGAGADILVSSGEFSIVNDVAKQLAELFDENTNVYIHHKIEIGRYREYSGEVKINGEYVVDGFAAPFCNLAGQVDDLYRAFGGNKQDILDIFEIYEHFADVESKSIFLGACKHHLSRPNLRYLPEILRASPKTNHFLELFAGAIARRELVQIGLDGTFNAFEVEGTRKDSTVVIHANYDKVKPLLFALGVPDKNIYCDYEFYDKSYFSLPQMAFGEEEVFVDAGCYNGATARDFIKRVNGKYKYIYAFEPDDESYLRCKKNMADIARHTLIEAGLWESNQTVHFNNNHGGDARISDRGAFDVPVLSLDRYLDGLPKSERHIPTYIKMDIEGAEQPAIVGAQRTIRRHRPKLAISVYHTPNNPFKIAKLILELNPEYTLYMRHYSLRQYETVLYAI